MNNTNRLARDWLLKNGYDYIWFKPHRDQRLPKNKEYFYTQSGEYGQNDLYNLFDGLCFDKDGDAVFLQMSTNRWHDPKPHKEFVKNKKIKILHFMAKKKNGRWELHYRLIN
jgi:hypothetical protein